MVLNFFCIFEENSNESNKFKYCLPAVGDFPSILVIVGEGEVVTESTITTIREIAIRHTTGITTLHLGPLFSGVAVEFLLTSL